jgi:hypothetical protein
MRNLGRVLAVSTFLLVSAAVADLYKVDIAKRVDKDLYVTNDKMYIETRFCFHYTFGETAVLKWEGQYSFNNKIIWDDNSSCEVKKIFK